MRTTTRWIGEVVAALGVLHLVASPWQTLAEMVRRGWWLAADGPEESAALWFAVAGLALLVMGLLLRAIVRGARRVPLSAAALFTLLMVLVFTAAGLTGALVGVVVGVVLLAVAARGIPHDEVTIRPTVPDRG